MTEFRLHGPPGCGKTTALAQSWVPQAVERFGPEGVVICSLTRTAAAEIAGRDLPLPKRNVGTLHALAYRGLQRPKLAESHIAEFNMAHPAFAVSGGKLDVDGESVAEATSGASLGDKLRARSEVLRHRLVPTDEWPTDVKAWWDRWLDWKEQNYLFDFTDLLEHALTELVVCPGAPYVLIVDEAQDCSALELALVREWGKHTSFFVLCGDGDQAIYEWRGASAEAFYGSELPEAQNYKLTQSYRVPRAVHRVATDWIAQVGQRYAVEYEPRDYQGEVLRHPGSARNTAALSQAIQQDVELGRDVMVLSACSFSLQGITRQLRADAVPFHNPFRVRNGAWNPMRGGVDRLKGLLRPAWDLEAELWTWREMNRWVELLKADYLPRGSKKAVAARKDNEGGPMPETVVTMLGDTGREILNAVDQGPEAVLEWLEPRLLASKRNLVGYALDLGRKDTNHLRRDPQVVVGTIHSVKGGEAEAVYLLPDLSASGMREWITPGPTRDAVRRLFYVGMTRAREKLTLCSPSKGASVPWPASL